MSLNGTLDDFNPIEIISVLGLLEKSGKLGLNRGDDEGLVIFRGGNIIYAASSGFRENLGSMLLARGLVNEDQLVESLAQQVAGSEEKRLGAILIDMGALSQEALNGVILEQVTQAVSNFSDWSSGHFDFTTVHVEDRGEVELQTEDLWAPLGLSPNHVLLRLAQRIDETSRAASTEPAEARDADNGATHEAASLQDFVHEVRGPQVKGELNQRILQRAGEIFGRCVLFSARHDGFRSIDHAQIGEAVRGPSTGTQLIQIALSRDNPNILARCATGSHTVVARLPQDEEDLKILEALGGPAKGDSIAISLSVLGDTVLVLYGDQLREEPPTDWLESLETFIDACAQQIETDIRMEIAAETSAV